MASAETQNDKNAVLAEWEAAQKEFNSSSKDEAAIKKKDSAKDKYMLAIRQIRLKEQDAARGPSLTKAPEFNSDLARAQGSLVPAGKQRVQKAEETKAAAAVKAAAPPPEEKPGAARVAAAQTAKGIEINVKSPLAWLAHPMTYNPIFGLFGNQDLLKKYKIVSYGIKAPGSKQDQDDTLKIFTDIKITNGLLDTESDYYEYWNNPVLMNGALTTLATFVINNLEQKPYILVVKGQGQIDKAEFLKDLYELKAGVDDKKSKNTMIKSLWGACIEINEPDAPLPPVAAPVAAARAPAAAPVAAAPVAAAPAARAPAASAPIKGQYQQPMGPKAPIEAKALVQKASTAPKPAQKAYMDELGKRYPQAKGPGGKSWVSGIMTSAGLSAGVAAALLVLL